MLEETENRLRTVNACYHSVQNILSFHLLIKNVKIQTYRAIICLMFYTGVKLGLLHYGKNKG